MTSDAQVRQDCRRAIDRLGRHPGVQIEVDQGRVALRGVVVRAVDRWKVEDAVSRVPGVVGTNAQLRVAPSAAP
jgi:osmotically-inducible protein OsmY